MKKVLCITAIAAVLDLSAMNNNNALILDDNAPVAAVTPQIETISSEEAYNQIMAAEENERKPAEAHNNLMRRYNDMIRHAVSGFLR
ncbi:hypothetical protein FACS189449_09800 [Alphaproteobacteria bacterium]|nr:hypothetical protein FACS189449_09800 [Alphaproteobacteria bacterium]